MKPVRFSMKLRHEPIITGLKNGTQGHGTITRTAINQHGHMLENHLHRKEHRVFEETALNSSILPTVCQWIPYLWMLALRKEAAAGGRGRGKGCGLAEEEGLLINNVSHNYYSKGSLKTGFILFTYLLFYMYVYVIM